MYQVMYLKKDHLTLILLVCECKQLCKEPDLYLVQESLGFDNVGIIVKGNRNWIFRKVSYLFGDSKGLCLP